MAKLFWWCRCFWNAIETDRKFAIAVELRTCLACMRGVEDEKHFLLECVCYQNERNKMHTKYLQIEDKKSTNKNEFDQFILRITKIEWDDKDIGIQKILTMILSNLSQLTCPSKEKHNTKQYNNIS